MWLVIFQELQLPELQKVILSLTAGAYRLTLMLKVPHLSCIFS